VQQTLNGRRLEFRTSQIRRIVKNHAITLCTYENSSQKTKDAFLYNTVVVSHSELRCIIWVSSVDKLLLAARPPNPKFQVCDSTFKIRHEIRETRKQTHSKRRQWYSEIYNGGFGCRYSAAARNCGFLDA